MTLQTMIVKNGLIRTNDQYPRSPRHTIRMTNSTSSSFDAPSFKDRSSSFTAEVLFALRMNCAVAPCHVPFLRNQEAINRVDVREEDSTKPRHVGIPARGGRAVCLLRMSYRLRGRIFRTD